MIAAMLAYDMPLWRPSSEGNNLIIQATIGCSLNRCTFCAMYRDVLLAALDAAQAGEVPLRPAYLRGH